MISHNCTSLEWIKEVSIKHNNADKLLVEKVNTKYLVMAPSISMATSLASDSVMRKQ